MPVKKTASNADSRSRIVEAARRDRMEKEKSYRERALKLFSWVCARCGREFSGKKLRELTVHHKDHDHDNNPPDGSNWELLCIYCHDNEHSRQEVSDWYLEDAPGLASRPKPLDSPFADLDKLLKSRK